MKNKKLLFSVTKKDFDISYFSGTGAGGQHRNKHMCCVRIKHSESGAKAIGKDSRSKDTNLKNAFKRLIETKEFKTWLRIKTAREMMTAEEKEKQKREIEESVDKMMLEENILVETKVDGKWVKGERDIK